MAEYFYEENGFNFDPPFGLDDNDDASENSHEREYQERSKKNRSAIDKFINSKNHVFESYAPPSCFTELAGWALQHYLYDNGYKVLKTGPYGNRKPFFLDIETGPQSKESILLDGQIFVKRGPIYLIITVDIIKHGLILMETSRKNAGEIQTLIKGLESLVDTRNFYRGQKFEYDSRMHFPDLSDRSWDSIVLPDSTKKRIRDNSIGFLNNLDEFKKFGFRTLQGVLLSGKPGTGKTMICEALMAEASGITCIMTKSSQFGRRSYLQDVFEMANRLSPSIIIIEDLDSIGRDRFPFGGFSLWELLEILDGLAKKKTDDIVVIGTTTCPDDIDSALVRPNRFGPPIELPLPSTEQRVKLIEKVSKLTPLSPETIRLIAEKTNDFTPIETEEAYRQLLRPRIIEGYTPGKLLDFSESEIAEVIASIKNPRKRESFGFIPRNGCNTIPGFSKNNRENEDGLINPR